MKITPLKLFFIPLLLFAFSLAVLFHHHAKTGDFIPKDVDLKGGTLISISTTEPVDTDTLERVLSKQVGHALVTGLSTSSGYGADIEVESGVDPELVLKTVESSGVEIKSYTIETIGPELGRMFFKQVMELLFVAYLLMAIAVYLSYRSFYPSFGIVFASIGDVIGAIAFATLAGVKISFAGFAALLMLIAYAVDTNVVLTTEVLRSKKDEFYSKYKKALITGVTITMTITVTMLITQFISTSRLLVNIAQILSLGFINDLIYTWIFNAGILEWRVMKK